MLKTKLASLALASIITIGGTGATAFAVESTDDVDTSPDKPSISIGVDKESKRAERAERPVDLADTKERMETKLQELLDSGKTQEEVDAIREKMEERFAGREARIAQRGERPADLEEAKERMETKLQELLDSGKTQEEVDAIREKMEERFAGREARIAERGEKGIRRGARTVNQDTTN